MSTRGVVAITKDGRTSEHYMNSDAYPDFAKQTLDKAIRPFDKDYDDASRFIVRANYFAGFNWIDHEEYNPEDEDTELTFIEHRWIVNLDNGVVAEDKIWRRKYEKNLNKKIRSDPLLRAVAKQIKVKSHTRRV